MAAVHRDATPQVQALHQKVFGSAGHSDIYRIAEYHQRSQPTEDYTAWYQRHVDTFAKMPPPEALPTSALDYVQQHHPEAKGGIYIYHRMHATAARLAAAGARATAPTVPGPEAGPSVVEAPLPIKLPRTTAATPAAVPAPPKVPELHRLIASHPEEAMKTLSEGLRHIADHYNVNRRAAKKMLHLTGRECFGDPQMAEEFTSKMLIERIKVLASVTIPFGEGPHLNLLGRSDGDDIEFDIDSHRGGKAIIGRTSWNMLFLHIKDSPVTVDDFFMEFPSGDSTTREISAPVAMALPFYEVGDVWPMWQGRAMLHRHSETTGTSVGGVTVEGDRQGYVLLSFNAESRQLQAILTLWSPDVASSDTARVQVRKAEETAAILKDIQQYHRSVLAVRSSEGIKEFFGGLKDRFKRFVNAVIMERLHRLTRPVSLWEWHKFKRQILDDNFDTLDADMAPHAKTLSELGQMIVDGRWRSSGTVIDIIVEKTAVANQSSVARSYISLKTQENVSLNIWRPAVGGSGQEPCWRAVEIPTAGHGEVKFDTLFPDFIRKKKSLEQSERLQLFLTIVVGEAHKDSGAQLRGAPRTLAFTFHVGGGDEDDTSKALVGDSDKVTWFAREMPATLNHDAPENQTHKTMAMLLVERLPGGGGSKLGRLGKIFVLYCHQ